MKAYEKLVKICLVPWLHIQGIKFYFTW